MSGEILGLPSAPVIEATIVGTDETKVSGVIQTASQPNIIILEANLANLTDVTTANATAAKHGLLPKLSNIGTDVLKGDGTWGAAPGGTLSSLLLPGPTNPADLLDIGFLGTYVSAGTKYTGLFRDATDGKYKLYQGLTVAPSSNVVNLTSGVLGELVLGTLTATTVAGTLSTASQPNITTLAAVNSLNGWTVGSGTLSGGSSVSATSLTGTLATASQPNITTLANVTTLGASATVYTGAQLNNTYFNNGNVSIGTQVVTSRLTVYESSTSTATNAGINIIQGSTGDALLQFEALGSRITTGIDQSDSNKYKIARGPSVDANPVLTIDPNYSGSAATVWTARTAANNLSWISICWSPELRLFCAVSLTGSGNGVMTSPNGITWTARTPAADNFWWSVCWSPELKLFCAVSSTGTNNRVMTSPNGITWTSRTSAVDNDWRSVCWSPDLRLFVAVAETGTGNRVMTSPDGITWTIRTSAANNSWTSVCWAPEIRLFAAVSNTGSNNNVMTSPDGITWTSRTASSIGWRSICWSSELNLFVAVANVGTFRVMSSPNGINWTQTLASDDSYTWVSVCWSPELRLFVATNTSNNFIGVMTSANGTSGWTSQATPQASFNSVCWAPEVGIFCSVSSSGSTYVMTSDSMYANAPNITIAGIRGKTTGVADAINVVIDSTGQLGTTSSSITKKHNIRDMSDFTDRLYLLDPVIFKWKPEHCEDQRDQYGLIAEHTAEVFPELAVKDPNDVNYLTVAYQNLVPMLLNELKKLKAKSTEHTELISSLRTELDVLKNKP